jgi:hypothetical protein
MIFILAQLHTGCEAVINSHDGPAFKTLPVQSKSTKNWAIFTLRAI